MVAIDQGKNTFFAHPFELKIFNTLNHWRDELKKQIHAGKLITEPSHTIEVPKPNFHVRPVHHLTIKDQTAIQYILLHLRPEILSHLQWSEGRVRLSNAISREGYWFKERFSAWARFRDLSLKKLQGRQTHALLTDISGYYENIDIKKLTLALEYAGGDATLCKNLSLALTKWSGNRGRGIPQGYSSSDVLGEMYLDAFDRNLKEIGLSHLRYVDDIRVFTHSTHEARCALREVTARLREIGLNVQTAKSKILPSEEAQLELDGIVPTIQSIINDLKEGPIPPVSPYEEDDTIPTNIGILDILPKSILAQAWSKFESNYPTSFNKSLYHFLLKRLAAKGMDDAVAFALKSLVEHPEETQFTLEYLKPFALSGRAIVHSITKILLSKRTIFPYQKYQILSWMYENNISNSATLNFCRSILNSPNAEWIIRPHAIAYLGSYATYRDLTLLQNVYQQSSNMLERATVVCAYQNALTEPKNAFYRRATGESDIIDAAIHLSRAA